MTDPDAGGFAPPPFKAAEALVLLRRQLRDLRPLVERGARYEIGGQPVLELAADAQAITGRVARRPARSPEWVAVRLSSSLDVRRFTEEMKRRLQQWEREE